MHQSGADTAQQLPPRTHQELLARYRELRQQHQSRHDALLARQRRALLIIAAVAVVVFYQTAASLHGGRPAWPMLLSFAAVIVLIVILVRLQNQIAHTKRMLAFYDRCLRRVDASEPHTALTGEDAIETPYNFHPILSEGAGRLQAPE